MDVSDSGSLIFHFGSALCSLDGGQGWIRSRNIIGKRMDNVKGGYSFPVTFRSNHLASSSKLFASFGWGQRLSGRCNCQFSSLTHSCELERYFGCTERRGVARSTNFFSLCSCRNCCWRDRPDGNRAPVYRVGCLAIERILVVGIDISGHCCAGTRNGIASYCLLYCALCYDGASAAGAWSRAHYGAHDYFLVGSDLKCDSAHCASRFCWSRGGGCSSDENRCRGL